MIKHFKPLIVLIFITLLIVSSYTQAVIEEVAFSDPKQEQRYQSLIAELRCLVCQNQNLADSNAELAKDLRRRTIELINKGKSDKEILAYMRERYGDFVLYRPPFNKTTFLLWIGPFILLLLALLTIFKIVKRGNENDLMKNALSNKEATQIKVRNLLQNTPDLTDKEEMASKEKDKK